MLGSQLLIYRSLGLFKIQIIAPLSGGSSSFSDWDSGHELIGEMCMPSHLLKRVSDNHRCLSDLTKNVLSEGVNFPCWGPVPISMPFQMSVDYPGSLGKSQTSFRIKLNSLISNRQMDAMWEYWRCHFIWHRDAFLIPRVVCDSWWCRFMTGLVIHGCQGMDYVLFPVHYYSLCMIGYCWGWGYFSFVLSGPSGMIKTLTTPIPLLPSKFFPCVQFSEMQIRESISSIVV